MESVACVQAGVTHLGSSFMMPSSADAQNMHWADQGAYTGEISPLMLKNRCDYVILGHSERRKYFYETDEDVRRKVEAALKEVNIVTSEHGLAAGTTSGVAEYLEYWKTLHGMGLHSVFAGPFFVPYDSTKEGVTEAELDADQEYNLAAYFLITDGGDFVTEWGHKEATIWAGVKKALSKPLGEAQALEGPDANKVYKRKFANGTVYLDPPGGGSEKQKCKESKEWGEAQTEITLTPARGAVCHS